eukprot:5459650-Pyramimonas_sp.AAC.1
MWHANVSAFPARSPRRPRWAVAPVSRERGDADDDDVRGGTRRTKATRMRMWWDGKMTVRGFAASCVSGRPPPPSTPSEPLREVFDQARQRAHLPR